MTSGISFRFFMPRSPFDIKMESDIPGIGVTAFYGRSGSGKTSLLRCFAGLEKPQTAYLSVHGKVWHDSQNKIFLPPHQREIGYVFQQGALFPHMTIQNNLLFGHQRTNDSYHKVDFNRVVELLELSGLLDRRPAYLSGGEKQRVAIGRALLNHPKLMLLDEPMASLDQTHKKEILPFLENLHRNFNIPILYVTHDREEMIQFADHLVLIEKGGIIAQGPIEEILTRVDLPIAREYEAASIVETTVKEHDHTFYLTTLAFAAGEMQVNWIDKPPGSSMRVRILAKDVSISKEHPQKTSIINIFPSKIEAMQAHGRGRMVLKLNMNGVSILARITQKSKFQLGLKPGDTVYAQIKSVALLI